jgi:type IV pilus modification protein PilV
MHERLRKNRSGEGFSLVELLVAMVLLSIGFLAMGQLFLASLEHSKQGRHDMAALNTANEVLERIRSVPFDNAYSLFNGIDTSDSTSVPPEARNWAAHVQEELGPTGYSVVNIYRTGDKPDLTANGLMEVEVLTSWVERGRRRTMRTSSYLVRMGS